jgi:hypothetical protein
VSHYFTLGTSGRANTDPVWSLSLPPGPLTKTRVLVPTSVVLQRLHDEVPTDYFTLGWLMHSLDKRSFGIIMLLLASVAIVPGLSIVAGLLLMIPAFQMIAGKPAPVFAAPSLPTRRLAAVVQRSCRYSGILRWQFTRVGTPILGQQNAWSVLSSHS